MKKKINKRLRIPKTSQEEYLRECGFEVICGVDEVGRGAWAGPLVAEAVYPHGCSLWIFWSIYAILWLRLAPYNF